MCKVSDKSENLFRSLRSEVITRRFAPGGQVRGVAVREANYVRSTNYVRSANYVRSTNYVRSANYVRSPNYVRSTNFEVGFFSS